MELAILSAFVRRGDIVAAIQCKIIMSDSSNKKKYFFTVKSTNGGLMCGRYAQMFIRVIFDIFTVYLPGPIVVVVVVVASVVVVVVSAAVVLAAAVEATVTVALDESNSELRVLNDGANEFNWK